MTLTPKGLNLLTIIKEMLEEKGDASSVSMDEIAEHSGLTIPSIRGTMSKLKKDGYIYTEDVPVGEEGKSRKHIAMTDLGWEADLSPVD